MSGPQPYTYVEGDTIADGANYYKLELVSPPLLVYGATYLHTGLDIRGLETNWGGKVAWRTMPVDVNYPNTWNLSENVRTASDEYFESFDVSGSAALWGQLALFTQLTTSGGAKVARCPLWGSARGAGWIAARQRVVIEPGASNRIVSVGLPFSGAGVSSVMFGAIYTGVSGTITAPTPQYRVFKTGDVTKPSGWTSLTAGSNVTADTRLASASEAVTTTSALLIQGGYKYSSTSSTYGIVDLIVAAKF